MSHLTNYSSQTPDMSAVQKCFRSYMQALHKAELAPCPISCSSCVQQTLSTNQWLNWAAFMACPPVHLHLSILTSPHFPRAIVVAHPNNVDLASLLGISAFSLDRWLEKDPEFLVSSSHSALVKVTKHTFRYDAANSNKKMAYGCGAEGRLSLSKGAVLCLICCLHHKDSEEGNEPA
eukprot:1156610-Pelagomonas_calceolata.AAC.7